MAIHFVTCGWRPAAADEFTFCAVSQLTSAMFGEFQAATEAKMIVAQDTRFLGEELPRECAEAATSHVVNRVPQKWGRQVYETTVAFKFIGELINEDKTVLGGEESAGLSIKGHYPEKDGILACLLAAEAVAARSASLTDQLEALLSDVGRLESGRIGVRLTPDLMPKLKNRLTPEPVLLQDDRSNKSTG